MKIDRITLTICRHQDGWAVEEGGQFFGHSIDREVVRAAANKRAREMMDAGCPCLVRVSGEPGFYGG
ncbi:MAG: hypothetical protein KGO51_07000 [Alphaproteobacteria bacterium]|nr:hypothetical protein [Alphaproteobacteria bacterium]